MLDYLTLYNCFRDCKLTPYHLSKLANSLILKYLYELLNENVFEGFQYIHHNTLQFLPC